MANFNDNLFVNLVYSVDTRFNYKYVLQYRIDYDKGKVKDIASYDGENFTYISNYELRNGSYNRLINLVLKFIHKTELDFSTIHI